jgi:hypothetical protein
VVRGRDRPAGEIRPGSFALDDPTEAEVAGRRKMAAEGEAGCGGR